jgi:hypothetical protein
MKSDRIEIASQVMTQAQYDNIQAIRSAVYAWQSQDFNNRTIRTLGHVIIAARNLGLTITVAELSAAQDYEDINLI